MHDTTPSAEAIRLAAIRRMDPVQRMRHAFDLSEWARALSLSRLRAAHPDRSDAQLVEILLARINTTIVQRP